MVNVMSKEEIVIIVDRDTRSVIEVVESSHPVKIVRVKRGKGK